MNKDQSMRSEQEVLAKFADEIAERVSNRVITSLRKLKTGLSGEETGLKNTWEEICVQVQFEGSYFWEQYDETASALIAQFVSKLKYHEVLAIWFQTDESLEWIRPKIISADDYPEDSTDQDQPPATRDDVVHYIKKTLYDKAGDYSNKNIHAYLDKH